MLAVPKAMSDLYDRLQQVGFDRPFVRETILPDWWEDKLAIDPTSRKEAELAIAKALSTSAASLADRTAPVALAGPGETHFKKRAGAPVEKLTPAVVVARRVAELVIRSCAALPPQTIAQDAATIRADLRARGYERVGLHALLEYSWSVGVPVILLDRLPKGAKRIDAMALVVNRRAVIAICSNRKSPAWLVWYLAHELGHVALGHLASGDAFDVDFGERDAGEHEVEADRFAEILVHGRADLHVRSQYRLTGEELARQAQVVAQRAGIDVGAVVANYAFTMAQLRKECWGSAQVALRELGLHEGGAALLCGHLRERIDIDQLSEGEARYLAGVTGVA